MEKSAVNESSTTFSVQYSTARKVFAAIVTPFICLFALGFMGTDDFMLNVMGLFGLVIVLLYFLEIVLTLEVVFEDDRIVKRRLFLPDTVIPTADVVMRSDANILRFTHGTEKNLRERITLYKKMIDEDVERIIAKIEKCYEIDLQDVSPIEDGACYTGRTERVECNQRVLQEYENAASSYRLLFPLLPAWVIVALFVAALSDDFYGLMPTVSPNLLLYAAIALAILSYAILARRTRHAPPADTRFPWSDRFKKMETDSVIAAFLAVAIGGMGLVIFLLAGNLLDCYILNAVGLIYYLDFYPRLSVWEKAAEAVSANETVMVVPAPPRRRSLQVSLVLMGALAASTVGQSQHYVYRTKGDCVNDWGREDDCETITETDRYGSRTYIRSRSVGGGHGGTSLGRVSVSRGGFGRLGGFHASFGG